MVLSITFTPSIKSSRNWSQYRNRPDSILEINRKNLFFYFHYKAVIAMHNVYVYFIHWKSINCHVLVPEHESKTVMKIIPPSVCHTINEFVPKPTFLRLSLMLLLLYFYLLWHVEKCNKRFKNSLLSHTKRDCFEPETRERGGGRGENDFHRCRRLFSGLLLLFQLNEKFKILSFI